MALIDRVTAWWQRVRGENSESPQRTTGAEVRAQAPARPVAKLRRFGAERDRRSVVRDCRAMYEEDPRAEGVISALARDAVRGGFRVKVTTDDGRRTTGQAQEIADRLIDRLELGSRLDDWARLTMRDGDAMLEVSVDEGRWIAAVTRKPTLEMHRASDETDRFADPERAFWWSDELWGGERAPMDAVWFAEWQIVHARWHHDEGSRYGTPLFKSARKPYKRMVEGEYDVAVRRKTRAGMKFLHVLEGASEAEIRAYRAANKDALNNPFAAVADFFTNKAGSISTVQGDARLGEIEDVQHHIRTWWVASPVPMSLLGYGQDLNRDVLAQQKEQYDEAVPNVTGWVEGQFVRPLLELQWLLQGIWPGSLEYEVIWASKKVPTPGDVRDLADALVRLKATGLFSEELLLGVAATVLPNLDVAEALAALEAARAAMPDEVDRIAAAAAETGRARRGE